MLPSFAQLQANINRALQEVAETADLVRALQQQIADLKNQISDPALQAQIDAAAAQAGQIADALDALQPHDTPPAPSA